MGGTSREAKVDSYVGPTKRGAVIVIVFGIIHRKLGESHKLSWRALFYKEGLREGREPGGKGGGGRRRRGGGKRGGIN